MRDILKDDPLQEQIRIGKEAEGFLNSKIGRYVQRRADAEIQSFTVELIGADPSDEHINRDLRMEIAKPTRAMEWLIAAINDGEAAVEEVHERDYDE